MNEIIWKTLVYNGEVYDRFEVSNTGSIRNIKTGTVYKQVINKEGYNQVCVSLGSRKNKKVFKIHRAVAETFCVNPENKPVVNHKDGNKQNNMINNLEWVTHQENVIHAHQKGLARKRYGTENCNSKLTHEDIVYIREHFISGSQIYGSRALGRKFNIDHQAILNIIHGVSYIND